MQFLAVQHELDFAGILVAEGVGSPVPYLHDAGAVLAFGERSFKVNIVQGVVGRPIKAAEMASETHGAKVLVLPLLPFGPAGEHTGFPGTISLSFKTWSSVVIEILENLVRDGFKRIVVVKGCGGHMGIEGPIYEFFCRQKRRGTDLDIRIFGEQAWQEIGKLASQSPIGHPDEVHAGGVETSMVLAKTPDLVRLDRLRKPGKTSKPYHWCWWVAEGISDTGATGDPTRYDVELGKRICQRMDEILCDFLGEMWKAHWAQSPSPPSTGA